MKFIEYLNSAGKISDVSDEVKVDVPKDKANKPPKGKGVTEKIHPYQAPDCKSKKEVDFLKEPKNMKESNYLGIFQNTRQIIADNPTLIENLVRDFKRNGLLGILVGEIMEHQESYKEIANLLGSKTYGETVSRKLSRALLEMTAPPVLGNPQGDMTSDDLDGPDLEDEPEGDLPLDDEDGEDEDDEEINDDMTGDEIDAIIMKKLGNPSGTPAPVAPNPAMENIMKALSNAGLLRS